MRNPVSACVYNESAHQTAHTVTCVQVGILLPFVVGNDIYKDTGRVVSSSTKFSRVDHGKYQDR